MNLKRLLPLLIVPLLLTASRAGANRTKNGPDLRNLPREIRSGEQGPFHVQGIAVDLERGYIYFSFTTKLLKMDFEGNLIGSVDGMTGHLGCLTMNPADGRVYGSLGDEDTTPKVTQIGSPRASAGRSTPGRWRLKTKRTGRDSTSPFSTWTASRVRTWMPKRIV